MNSKLKFVKVIKPGFLVRSETGVILDARSTVTLIQSDDDNILVDTSSWRDRELLLKGLQEEGLTPFDINIIIITHYHRDHVGNNEIFPTAQIYMHGLNKQIPNYIKINSFPFSLKDNIEIIETPGHSWDSISVIVKIDLIYAITGDAIPLKSNYIEWVPPTVHVDADLAIDSMRKIVQLADIIIPGHDVPFKLEKTRNYSSNKI